MVSHIKPVFRCVSIYKNLFKHSQCALTISVGQKAHEEEMLAATVELVNTRFSSCIIFLDDTLQRHTMALNTNKSAEDFYEMSFKEGDLWLQRNKKYYSKLTILKDIIRWNTWLNHPSFNKEKEKVTLLIKEDPFYRSIFQETVNKFLSRYCSRLHTQLYLNLEKARQHCLDYLIEECAALCLRLESTCHFEIYPSRRNLAMAETYKRFILPKYPDLLRPISMKFKSRSSLQPQHFESLQNKKEYELI